MATINGTSGPDSYAAGTRDLVGTTGDDSINGLGGDDTIRGNGSSINGDFLYGGDGNDTLYGGINVDWLSGDAGNDVLYSSESNDFLDGGAGSDFFFVSGTSNGYDHYTGGDAGTTDTDTIISDKNFDTTIGLKSLLNITNIQGNTFHSTVLEAHFSGAALDFSNIKLINITGIDGGAGADNFTGSAASDSVSLNGGNDYYSTDKTATASTATDTVFGGSGTDIALFGSGKAGTTLTANANGTWTVYDPTIQVTWNVSHAAATNWTVNASTQSITRLFDFEQLSFGGQSLSSTSPITPQAINSGPTEMTFASNSTSDDVAPSSASASFSDLDVTSMAANVSDLMATNFHDADASSMSAIALTPDTVGSMAFSLLDNSAFSPPEFLQGGDIRS